MTDEDAASERETDEDAASEREQLHAALQAVLDQHEGGPYLIGWVMVMEVSAPNGERWLLTRTGDTNGKGLVSWQALGYIHSVTVDFEDQGRDGRVDAEDDGPGG